ncbi:MULTISPECIES: cytochrome P450 [unclassified Sphingomonas]|uniref:cytochrome P450 n=1 Tax=unclassified Sphingomonas TaxID=196159 RepID=UPI0006F7D22B|nr:MULTISPECIES: cytochrome P450 [unclassified Sphingomonas]KQX19568.1 cytochrome [Sphingomonas sp. Root1294]KQY65769.1 cytochrome [Sphingomonas sp. Root50]KRB94925.1 cytochrome [Sphingomonas sp. Root720]
MNNSTRPIDHHSAAFAHDHLDLYRDARAHCPILRSDAHGGFAILTRYADNRAALRNHEAFASGRFRSGERLDGGVAIPPNGMRIGMIEMDGDEARLLRALLQPWFTIAAVEAAAPRIAQISAWLIDRIIARGACDVVEDIAKPMPSLLILDILGLPLDRWRDYGRVLHEAVAKSSGSIDGLRWLADDLRTSVAERRCHPEGLIAALAAAEVDGRPLGDAMVCELAMMLLFGGTDTTIAAIGHALRHLTEHPDDRRRLIERPALIPAAVEEILRLHSPSTGVARTVTAPVEIGGERFEPGQRVLCAINSANRDDGVFADGEAFDLDRPKRPHLAFGWGAHACLGQNLARADLRILLGEILARMPDFAVDVAASERYASIPLVNGHARMPMRFTPGEPRSPVGDGLPVLTAARLRPVPKDHGHDDER